MGKKAVYYEEARKRKNYDFAIDVIHDPGSTFSEHWHDSIEIIFVMDGMGYATLEDRTYAMQSGEFALINLRDVHSTMTPEDYVTILQYPLEFLEKVIPDIEEIRFVVPYRPETEKDKAILAELSQELYAISAAYLSAGGGNKLDIYLHSFKFLQTLYNKCRVKAKQNKRREQQLYRLDPLLEFTNANHSRKITIEEAADVLSLQPQYFCRIFKATMGSTYLGYVNQVRLGYIYYDLQYTSLPINRILENHGFTNLKLFRRLFYEKFGTTPSELRKEISKEAK